MPEYSFNQYLIVGVIKKIDSRLITNNKKVTLPHKNLETKIYYFFLFVLFSLLDSVSSIIDKNSVATVYTPRVIAITTGIRLSKKTLNEKDGLSININEVIKRVKNPIPEDQINLVFLLSDWISTSVIL